MRRRRALTALACLAMAILLRRFGHHPGLRGSDLVVERLALEAGPAPDRSARQEVELVLGSPTGASGMTDSKPANPAVLTCPECGIETRVRSGAVFAFPEAELARICKHNSGHSICPNFQQMLDSIRKSML